MADSPGPHAFRFGPFEVDRKTLELHKNGRKVRLQEKPFQLLILLLERPGEIVTRDELRSRLWPADTFVDFDHSLGTAMGKLRAALGDSAGEPRFIETIPRRGYRFIARVAADPAPASQPAQPTPPPPIRTTPFWMRWPVAAGGVALTLALLILQGNVVGFRDRLVHRRGTQPIHSIAVLPFEDLSQDPSQEYFADGMTEELINSLAQIHSLRVISRTSSVLYKGKHRPLSQIARELNVDSVLEGTLRLSGRRVRVTAQLIQAQQERHLWAESYEHDGGDFLTLQAALAQAIANEIQAKLTSEEAERFSRTRHVSPEAYEAYLKGRYFFNRSSEGDLQRAFASFEQAVQKDPTYAPAYAPLSDCYFRFGNDRLMPGAEAYAKSKDAARKSLSLDDTVAEAHTALARVMFQHDWDHAAADKEFRRAVDLSPSSAPVRTRYALFLIAMGRKEEALAQGRKACVLDPVSRHACGDLGDIYYYAHELDLAISAWRKTLELYPDAASVHFSLARALWKKGNDQEARNECLQAEQLWGADTDALSQYRNAYAKSGMKGIWRKELDLAHYEHPFDFAVLHAQLGETEQAFHWLEKSFAEHEYRMIWLKVNPQLDILHSDPRFRDLVRRVGLPL
jgi:TolB-like protein/DNA-binding winged helix-turn-helix (wHTH) protein/Tfp pilus assembly protein PilF